MFIKEGNEGIRRANKPLIDIGVIPGKGLDSNVYLLSAEDTKDGLVIIDTGTGAYSNKLLKEIKSMEASKYGIMVILTHCHYDHIGGVSAILEEYRDAKVYIHESSVPSLKNGDNERTVSDKFGIDLGKIEAIGLKDGDKKRLGEVELEIVHTPGHTEDSICIYIQKTKTLFSGDTVFANGGLGRWDLPTGSLSDLKNSIAKISRIDVSGLYPGHGYFVGKGGNEHIKMSLEEVNAY
ncbi:MAG: MBL fold metallo-hydrolase [Thermoplasmata archaeon]